MKLQKIAERLQAALCQRGRYIRINKMQYYTDDGRRGVIYQVCETVEDTGKKKVKMHCKSTKLLDVVLTLRELYEGGDG